LDYKFEEMDERDRFSIPQMKIGDTDRPSNFMNMNPRFTD